MNQIIDSIPPQLNDSMLFQMNQNMSLINQQNIPPLIQNQHNFPINPKNDNQQTGNNPQNEDTSKILLLI